VIARYQAIERILSHMRDGDLVVSTTGMISRELFTPWTTGPETST